jgi:hypothetical protein
MVISPCRDSIPAFRDRLGSAQDDDAGANDDFCCRRTSARNVGVVRAAATLSQFTARHAPRPSKECVKGKVLPMANTERPRVSLCELKRTCLLKTSMEASVARRRGGLVGSSELSYVRPGSEI